MDAMPGDAEAAGAVAGMIELEGRKPIGQWWDSFVGYEWHDKQQYGFNWALASIVELPPLEGVVRLFRSPWIGGVSTMTAERIAQLHPTKAKALADVIGTLTGRREKLTADIQRLKEALADEIAREEGDR